ncbi:MULTISPECIES: hypothetical protein [Pseudomonas]|uniref:N-acetyltransferase n=1 Tax=Pseudomonas aphyarum TaxID=2942629 RepID=A0ABT5PRQ7_9PSED|nr:hypothetical protein [Pseudomonas aphyarum]MDD0967491.1 hypothetical protein [Pseudomonas aphyarum]MDD1126603.1 hypothetical protein [Pseudomonas aphyarum]
MPRERNHLRYQLYKSQARKLARLATTQLQIDLEMAGPTTLDLSKVRFETIDSLALSAFECWESPHFSWEEVIGWKAREPLALDIAIWFESELCGLCFANPNKSRQRIRIVRLEGRPRETHPLKNRVVPLSVLAIEQYARIIGSSLIEAQEPFQGAIPIYEQLGFGLDNEGRLVKTVGSLVL